MLSEPFIRRPVATSLLSLALALAGALAFANLPVAPLPQVAYPTIVVSGALPGASPETMASAVATPLERQFGRIAGVTEMTSSSGQGSTTVVLQFDLSRDIDAAARDVQAAINAARGQLPANLPSNPTYRKVNPADAPAIILSLTSDTVPISRIYDLASSVLAQEISQLDGVGQVNVGGGALPAVRVELNPNVLNKYGISLEQIRAVLNQANANRPKGQVADERTSWEVHANDQLLRAADYLPLIITAHNGGVVRLTDVGTATDGVQDVRTAGLVDDRPAVSVVVMTAPGANVIETVDRINADLPRFRALLPAAIDLRTVIDRTTTIRASVHDVERTLVIATGLVVAVVFAFLGSGWSTVIPSVAVPLSLLGTFGVMWFLGYSLDNLSLMALTISTGFVVDDAIVVLENIARHLNDAIRGGAHRCARGWIHGAVDEPLARRRLHTAVVHGRPGRPALPRVRRDAIGGRRRVARHLADDNPDALRTLSASHIRQRSRVRDGSRRAAGTVERADVRARAGWLRSNARLGVDVLGADAHGVAAHGRLELVPGGYRAEGILSSAG
jgi:multidrug efflux pump